MDIWSTFDRANLDYYLTTFNRLKGKGKKILEIGSGYGFTSVFFALMGASEVRGIEFVPEGFHGSLKLKESFDPALPVHFIQGDATKKLPYDDSTFDCLTLIEVISHVVCDDFRVFMAEMSRVLKPGGLLLISDGNNQRSPFRRKLNRKIWNRFENGPPTMPGEDLDGHKIEVSYLDTRRKIAAHAVPGLSSDELDMIARGTSGFTHVQVEDAAKKYFETGMLPESFYINGTCPIDPVWGVYAEHLFDPISVQNILKSIGLETQLITTRRKLPLQKIWDTFPRITMLAANGFVLLARKN